MADGRLHAAALQADAHGDIRHLEIDTDAVRATPASAGKNDWLGRDIA